MRDRFVAPITLLACAVAVGWGAAAGCSAAGSPRNTSTATGGFGASPDAAAGGTDSGLVTPEPQPEGGGLGDSACTGQSFQAEPFPLDIFVMLDQSGSMNEDAGNNLSKWQTIRQALTKFVQQPNAVGMGMGIQFFGLPQPLVPGCTAISCSSDTDCTGGCTACLPGGVCQGPFNPDVWSCEAADYAWADVPIQLLPQVGSAIISAVGVHGPGGNTPTLPALTGAIEYAKAWATKHPDHITIVELATDGEPSPECGDDINQVAAVAATGYGGNPSIKTFVIGVGPSLQKLDLIGSAGGTKTAFHIDLDPAAEQNFLNTLNRIRIAALACNYDIPSPPAGMQEDFGRVNVEYTPGDGKPAQDFPKVQSSADCPPMGDGWYYDDNTAPKRILLCPSTCDKIAVDLMAKIDIVLGCLTIVK